MKAISSVSRQLFLRLSALCWLWLLVGCQSMCEDNSTWGQASLTSKLWHSPAFCNFNEPAAKPDLKLFQHEGPADVLVQYNEVREKDGSVRRRTFFLNRNIERLQAGRKPQFVHATTVAGLKPVPVLARGSGQPAPATGLHATVSEDWQTFTLHANGQVLDTFRLPTYETPGGKVQKTLLTPLTVTGDVVIVGLYAAAVAAVLWVQSGGPGLNCH